VVEGPVPEEKKVRGIGSGSDPPPQADKKAAEVMARIESLCCMFSPNEYAALILTKVNEIFVTKKLKIEFSKSLRLENAQLF
jgi:hypothetical protein